MQTATYGIYKNGRIILDEPVANVEESKVIVVFLNDAAQSPAFGHEDHRPVQPAEDCNPPAAMFCGAAGEALNPAEHPFNNLSRSAIQIGQANLNPSPKASRLLDLFDLYGAWEDERDVETVISDIRNSRVFRAGIQL
jgi:hypothetical protein